MDHSHDDLLTTEKKESEERINEQGSCRSSSESDLLPPISCQEVQEAGVGCSPEIGNTDSCLFEDSWGPSSKVPSHPYALDLSSQSASSLVAMDSTERLKDESDDYRQKFRHSKRPSTSRHLQAFKHSSMSRSFRSNDREYVQASSSEDSSNISAPPGLTTLTRAASAPLQIPPPPTFMVPKGGPPISEWDLTETSGRSTEGSTWLRKRRRRPLVTLHRENLKDSLVWFSFHAPKCVLEDLISNEWKKCEDKFTTALNDGFLVKRRESKSSISSDNSSVSSLSDDESKGDSKDINQIEDPTEMAANNIALPTQIPDSTLKMPHSVKRDCALLFVDISGFTKLSTILDEESLSKVSNKKN